MTVERVATDIERSVKWNEGPLSYAEIAVLDYRSILGGEAVSAAYGDGHDDIVGLLEKWAAHDGVDLYTGARNDVGDQLWAHDPVPPWARERDTAGSTEVHVSVA